MFDEPALAYLEPYKVKGSEIVAKYCPYCHGGQHRDKYTFALNLDVGAYNCMRGSCGAQGHITQFRRDMGVEQTVEYSPPKKAYKQPEKKPKPLHETAMQYINLRRISDSTVAAYQVGADENGNLQFPYLDQDGKHQFNKFRPVGKVKPGERKAWREADTMPILYGMHLCDASKPLTIFEGEFDAMAGYEAGIPNCVSVPSGAEDDTWIDPCWDFVMQFPSIYVYGDNDDAGIKMIRRLCVKFGEKKVFVVEHPRKDANELLFREGPEAVQNCWENAKEQTAAGLLKLADVVPLDVTTLETANTSIAPLNKLIGGFYMGDVTIETGKRGEGKSTIVSQIMLDAIQGGYRVCAYSGELRADRFQYWTDLQAAGMRNIREYFDHAKDRQVYYVPQEIRSKIHRWYGENYYLYDNSIVSTEEEISILQAFEVAAKRYDCRVFLVDNLMTADYGKLNDSDFYRQQSRFVGQLVSFANRFNVHVHLVAHPRKTAGIVGNDDVSVSGHITNRAANFLSVSRTNRADRGCDLVLKVTKNRWEGNCGDIGLNYCNISHRLYVPNIGDVVEYGWADVSDQFMEIEPTGDLPW